PQRLEVDGLELYGPGVELGDGCGPELLGRFPASYGLGAGRHDAAVARVDLAGRARGIPACKRLLELSVEAVDMSLDVLRHAAAGARGVAAHWNLLQMAVTTVGRGRVFCHRWT